MGMNFTDEQIAVYTEYYNSILENQQVSDELKEFREKYNNSHKLFESTEKSIRALQVVGQMTGEVIRKLKEDIYIVKSNQGPRYIVNVKPQINPELLKEGTRVALDVTTLTITDILPTEVDPTVYAMATEGPSDKISFESIGGLKDQIRELREVIELPLKNPEIFDRVGIVPPKGVLLYGPPGTGKTLMAKAAASTMDVNFLKVVASAIIEKYIGESSRMIREMFAYARERAPCIIFIDEIDAIGGKRTSDNNSSDREVQRTLMELLNQMDGFKTLENVKIVMATNRPDILDPALLRPGRLDRKIEVPLPSAQGRREILKIHTKGMNQKNVDYEELIKLSEGFNGADLRHACTESGLNAIREDRDFVIHEDFVKAVRKIANFKNLESKIDYLKQ